MDKEAMLIFRIYAMKRGHSEWKILSVVYDEDDVYEKINNINASDYGYVLVIKYDINLNCDSVFYQSSLEKPLKRKKKKQK